MATVYVISKSGKPLMPTTRCGHIRLLLKQGKARVVERKPFTIQLEYETTEETQPLVLGIDPGRTNIGVAVTTENGTCVFSAQLETRNKDIPKLMQKRKMYRQQHRKYGRRDKRRRRARVAGTVVESNQIKRLLPGYEKPVVCKDIRNKEARFNNRRHPDGWLTPTANHLLKTHLNFVKKIQKFLPISKVVIETNRFAFMELDNPNIQKWQYQNGPLKGIGGVKSAVYAQQDGHCIFCDKSIVHYHHIVPRHKGGSESLYNRVGLCEGHHHLVHTDAEWEKKLASLKAGLNKKYNALSVLNQIIPYLFKEMEVLFPFAVYATTGQDTKACRDTLSIQKDHHFDAYCIAISILNISKVRCPICYYQFGQFRRHDRQACHKQNINRVYLLDGKAVATNRHKAIEQKVDSLEEFRSAHSHEEVSRLIVKEHSPEYKRMNRIMPGAMLLHNNEIDVLLGTVGTEKSKTGRVPSYAVFLGGIKERYKKCVPLQQNRGLCCF